MKQTKVSENIAAVETVGRELIVSALQRNPIVAVATAVLGPILGLFKRRVQPPTEVRKMRLESYSSRTLAGPPGGRRHAEPRLSEAVANPQRTGSEGKTKWRTSNLNRGGRSHG